MGRRQSVDSSLDEYEPTDSETEYYSGSETELTDIDDDMDKANAAEKALERTEQSSDVSTTRRRPGTVARLRQKTARGSPRQRGQKTANGKYMLANGKTGEVHRGVAS